LEKPNLSFCVGAYAFVAISKIKQAGAVGVILATWKAEIRRIVVQSQSGQIGSKTLSQKIPTQKRSCRMA
jgi:hypothetical protein